MATELLQDVLGVSVEMDEVIIRASLETMESLRMEYARLFRYMLRHLVVRNLSGLNILIHLQTGE